MQTFSEPTLLMPFYQTFRKTFLRLEMRLLSEKGTFMLDVFSENLFFFKNRR